MTIYDLIGDVFYNTGETKKDSDGVEYPVMAAVEGYHVNLLSPEIDVSDYELEITTPQVKFAGRDDTIFLRFIDRAEWLSLGIEVLNNK